MDTMMSFLDKIYSDTKTLTIVYVVGAVLLLFFIVMLMISLKKPTSKKVNTKVLDEPKIDKDEQQEEKVENTEVITETKEEIKNDTVVNQEKEEQKIEEENTNTLVENNKEEENPIAKALDNVENKDILNNVEEEKKHIAELSAEIPDVDTFVDNVVKKTYEKNEQFSSVYVSDNTTSIKTVNPEENTTKEEIIDNKETEEIKEEQPVIEPIVEETKEENSETSVIKDEPKETISGLDSLKKAIEDKKNEVNKKQDELAAKLAGLKKETKNDDVMKAEDLLNKLNSMKNE